MPASDAPPPDAPHPDRPRPRGARSDGPGRRAEGEQPGRRRDPAAVLRWRRIGVALLVVEALAPLAAAVALLVQLLAGSGGVARNEGMVIALCLLATAGLAVVARGVWRGNRAVRTAGVFWQVLMLGVVPALWQAGQPVAAVAVVLFVAVTAYAVVVGTGESPGPV